MWTSDPPGTSGYTIADPRPIAERAPYTFFLPDTAELAAVARGDRVKLLFDYTVDTQRWSAERRWVTIVSIDGDRLSGTLENRPDEPASPLSPGDPVAFERHHLLAIDWDDPGRAPPPADVRQFWDRCMVDGCILAGEPVDYLYREAPDMTRKDDRDPDSGWRLRASQGAIDADESGPEYVALGKVLNADDSWLHLIDAPIGSAFQRGEDGAFHPAD